MTRSAVGGDFLGAGSCFSISSSAPPAWVEGWHPLYGEQLSEPRPRSRNLSGKKEPWGGPGGAGLEPGRQPALGWRRGKGWTTVLRGATQGGAHLDKWGCLIAGTPPQGPPAHGVRKAVHRNHCFGGHTVRRKCMGTVHLPCLGLWSRGREVPSRLLWAASLATSLFPLNTVYAMLCPWWESCPLLANGRQAWGISRAFPTGHSLPAQL